jgi:WD40 repeat protein
MKRIFKSLLLITLALGTTNAFGMDSLFEESKEVFYTPGTQHSPSMPPASAALTPQAMMGLTLSQAAWQTRDTESHMDESKQEITVKDHSKEPHFQLLYDLLTTMPRELINLILDYAKEFEGRHVRTINEGLSLTRGIIMLSPHIIGAYDFEIKITLFDLETGKQLKTIEQAFVYNPIKFSENELAFFSNLNHKIIIVNWQKDTKRTMKIKGYLLDGAAKLPHGPLMTHYDQTATIKFWDPRTEKLIKKMNVGVDKYYKITPLSERIIATAEPPLIILWDIHTGNKVTTITLKPDTYSQKLILLSAKILAIALEKTIEIHDITIPKLIHTIETQDNLIDVTKFPTENIIVAAIREREMTIALYDPATGECLKHFGTGLLAIPNFAEDTITCPSDTCIVARGYNRQNLKHEIKIWN